MLLWENEFIRVLVENDKIIVIAKNSDQEDNRLYIHANSEGGIGVVAPQSVWHPTTIDFDGGFWVYLN